MLTTKIRRLWSAAGLSALYLITCSTHAAGELDSEITVHQVDMKGTGFEREARELFEDTAQKCRLLGYRIEPIPPGDKYMEITQQRYYAPGITTIYETIKNHRVQADCSAKRQITKSIETHSVNGICKFNPALKIATGFCAITVAGLNTKAPLRSRTWGVPKGEFNTIAGHPCKVMKLDKLMTWDSPGENCLADTGAFAGVLFLGYKSPGVPLKSVLFSKNGSEPAYELEATSVTNNLKVAASLLAPQLTDTYQMRDNRGWQRDAK